MEKLSGHSYITLKQQSLEKIAVFCGFMQNPTNIQRGFEKDDSAWEEENSYPPATFVPGWAASRKPIRCAALVKCFGCGQVFGIFILRRDAGCVPTPARTCIL